MQIHPHSEFNHSRDRPEQGLQNLLDRLVKTVQRDELVRQTTNQLRESLQVDRWCCIIFIVTGKVNKKGG